MLKILRNIRNFYRRGRTKITITLPFWRVPRCFHCNRILWGRLPIHAVEGTLWCWDCGRMEMFDLEAAFGKPTEAKDDLMWYDWNALDLDDVKVERPRRVPPRPKPDTRLGPW